MKRILSLFLAGLLAISFMACATSGYKGSDKPGRVVTTVTEVTATVEAVDYESRKVTLKGPEGDSVTLHVDERARNFNQVKVGDKVKVEYYDSVALYVQNNDGSQPSAGEGAAVSVAPLGEKPGIAAVETVVITATVEAVDYKSRRVTLKGPKGKSRTFRVDKSARDMEKVKVGDQVVARHTVAVAISVSKP